MTDDSGGTKDRKGASGLFIPAGVFLGMGIGWIFDYLVQGIFIGIGLGFLAMVIVMLKRPKG